MRILANDGLNEEAVAYLKKEGFTVETEKRSTDDLLGEIGDFDALLVRSATKVTREILEAGTKNGGKLKIVGRGGVGTDNIDLEAAKELGVIVKFAPNGNTNATAEHALGLMFAVARKVPMAHHCLKGGVWHKKRFQGNELHGKTLGVIGFGRIGVEVGKRAAAFGMNVIAYDPLIPEDEIRRRGADPASLQDLYAWSDFISLHLPLTVDTRDMIGRAAFAQMKDGVRIVCAARGGIIDEVALVEALNSGKVGGAALDVFSVEPPGLTETVSHPRVIATPHIGAQTAEAQSRASEDIAQEVLSALRGAALRWRVA